MQLDDAIHLIQHPTSPSKTFWADLGCGDGLFTHALSKFLADESTIIAIDKNAQALKNVVVEKNIQLKKEALNFIEDEFPFKNLSGILMANSLHFVKDKARFLEKCIDCLSDEGYFLIVEYDTDTANPWVPYPVSFDSLKKLLSSFNFKVEKLQTLKSRFGGVLYSAIAMKR
jgi:ubiquinone/menaquinone biosynthesis C-methylase UbiE